MTDQVNQKPATEQFRDAIAALGITPPDTINTDGQIHRFSSNGKQGNDSGWYAFHSDGSVPMGSFGDFRTSQKVSVWVADMGRDLTPDEKDSLRKRQEDMKRARDADMATQRAKAKDKAAGILRISKPAPDDHPYLTRKGIKAHGIRQWKDLLVIPMMDETGEVQSLQLIAGDGGKKFLKGGKMQGCFYALGDTRGAEHILIAEGYATAATIHEVTGWPVVVAYNAGNVRPVAKLTRAAHPSAAITICADDDFKTEGNPGLAKAKIAADEVGGAYVVPEFGKNRPDKATDFNDMAALAGKDAVTRFFTKRFSELRTASTDSGEQQASSGESEDEPDAAMSCPETPQMGSGPVSKPRRHFTDKEMCFVTRIWKTVPRRITYHSENSYQIVFNSKDKIIVTRNRIELSGKAQHRPDAAYKAACEHALQFWDGRMNVHGSQQHKIRTWAFASLHGIEVANFTPSESERIEAEKIIATASPYTKFAMRPVVDKKQAQSELTA